MAIAAAHLTTNFSNSDSSSYNTASIAPSTNALVLVAVAANRGDSIDYDAPSLSGCGLTWVEVASLRYDTAGTGRHGVSILRGMGTPSSGAITITFGASHRCCVWSIAEFTGVDTGGSNGSAAIVQSATNKDESGTTSYASATLAAFGDAGNATYAAVGSGGYVHMNAGTGFTELGETTATAPYLGLGTEYKLSNDTSPDAQWVNPGDDTTPYNTGWGIVAVEIKAAAAGGPVIPVFMNQYRQRWNRAQQFKRRNSGLYAPLNSSQRIVRAA